MSATPVTTQRHVRALPYRGRSGWRWDRSELFPHDVKQPRLDSRVERDVPLADPADQVLGLVDNAREFHAEEVEPLGNAVRPGKRSARCAAAPIATLRGDDRRGSPPPRERRRRAAGRIAGVEHQRRGCLLEPVERAFDRRAAVA